MKAKRTFQTPGSPVGMWGERVPASQDVSRGKVFPLQ